MNVRHLTTTSALVLLLALLVSPKVAFAQDESSTSISNLSTYDDPETHYTHSARLSILGGAGMVSGMPEQTMDATVPNRGMAGGAVLLDFGKGNFTFQTGVQYLNLAILLTHNTNGVTDETTAVTGNYVGVPLVVKYNYIEHPTAVFSIKAGIMPAYLVSPNQTLTVSDASGNAVLDGSGSTQSYTVNHADAMALAGFTGSGPINDNYGFLIDATYFYGVIPVDGATSHNQGALLSMGVTFDL